MTLKKRYQNPDNIEYTVSWQDFLRWRKERIFKHKDISLAIPQMPCVETEFLRTNRKETWVVRSMRNEMLEANPIGSVYFVGDSGYFHGFKAIGSFGPIASGVGAKRN